MILSFLIREVIYLQNVLTGENWSQGKNIKWSFFENEKGCLSWTDVVNVTSIVITSVSL